MLESPVREYSGSAEIQAWLDKLAKMRRRYADRADALRQIEREEREATELLRRAKTREMLRDSSRPKSSEA